MLFDIRYDCFRQIRRDILSFFDIPAQFMGCHMQKRCYQKPHVRMIFILEPVDLLFHKLPGIYLIPVCSQNGAKREIRSGCIQRSMVNRESAPMMKNI